MAWTSSDLTAIEEAIANGALEVQYTDKKVKYRTISELLQVRQLIRNALGLNKNKLRKSAIVGKGV